jgi:hypothetical protein
VLGLLWLLLGAFLRERPTSGLRLPTALGGLYWARRLLLQLLLRTDPLRLMDPELLDFCERRLGDALRAHQTTGDPVWASLVDVWGFWTLRVRGRDPRELFPEPTRLGDGSAADS